MDNKPFDYTKPFHLKLVVGPLREAVFYKVINDDEYPLKVLVKLDGWYERVCYLDGTCDDPHNIPEKKFELEVDKYYWDRAKENIVKIYWKDDFPSRLYPFQGICVYGQKGVATSYNECGNFIDVAGKYDLIEEVSREELIKLGVIKP